METKIHPSTSVPRLRSVGKAGGGMRRALAMFFSTIFMILGGCATKPPETITIEKPVTVPGPVEYVQVPAALFVGCISPAPAGPTNGDLLQHDHDLAGYVACLEGELAAIKSLK